MMIYMCIDSCDKILSWGMNESINEGLNCRNGGDVLNMPTTHSNLAGTRRSFNHEPSQSWSEKGNSNVVGVHSRWA